MIEPALVSLVLFLILICFSNWRIGFFVTILFGFLQDPLRKLMPGEPVFMVVFIGLFIFATIAGAKSNNIPLTFQSILRENPSLINALTIFIFFVFIQAIITILKLNSVILAGIGLMAYLTPWVIIPIAYQYAYKKGSIETFFHFYLLVSLCITSGIYLSFFGIEWRIFEQVGSGIHAFAPTGEKLVLHCGFMRAPEVAAWHAGASACITIMLFVSQRKKGLYSWISGLITVFFIVAIILTGRRKMLMEVALFTAFFGWSLFYFRKEASRLAFFILICGITFTALANYFFSTYEFSSEIMPYYRRGMSVGEDAPGRLNLMTIKTFRWIIHQNGFFGSGAGTGSQGARFFGGGTSLVGLAAEGGLGKVLAELGIPGLLLILWLAGNLFNHLWTLMRRARSSGQAFILYGMISFLISNAIVFMTAHQIFGDLFVLFILGSILGFILATSKLVLDDNRKQKALSSLI